MVHRKEAVTVGKSHYRQQNKAESDKTNNSLTLLQRPETFIY